MRPTSRRTFLKRTLRSGAQVGAALASLDALAATALVSQDEDPFSRGERIGRLEFEDRRRSSSPRERLSGRGLAGRYRLDLSTLTPDTLIIPNKRFYVRTRCPDRIDLTRPWRIRLSGLVDKSKQIATDAMTPLVRPMGVHLLECAGSGTGGLISAANFSGVPVEEVFKQARPDHAATRVAIKGFDEHSSGDGGFSNVGASWVFTLDQLRRAEAFLATRMNGRPISRDHGFPMRLFVPGWYGCCCVKWVQEIRFVGERARATGQMREFASRTHQDGVPRRARDYLPAEMDLSAMPIRVEKWRVDGNLVYRVVGIIWGGRHTTDKLEIRFGRDGRYERVSGLKHKTTRTWTLWTHAWRPRSTGRFEIMLRVDDAGIPTRHMSAGYYARSVDVKEI